MIKNTMLSVLGLAANSLLFAGAMGPVCTPENVTVPCAAQAWSLGLQGLYLNTIHSPQRGYRYTPSATMTSLNNDWSWGYFAEGSYYFHTGNDITLDWTHLSSNPQQQGLATIFSPGVLRTYTATANNHFDRVNLITGQYIDLNALNKMRLYGGLQYASIQQNATNYYSAALPLFGNTAGGYYYDNTDFKGVGPIIGANYAYDLLDNLSITANGSLAVDYGTSRYSSGYTLSPTHLVVNAIYASKKVIVPAFEAKLGLNYGYHAALGIFNIEGGYQVAEYYHPLQGFALQTTTNPISEANYGVYGPYLGLSYLGNI